MSETRKRRPRLSWQFVGVHLARLRQLMPVEGLGYSGFAQMPMYRAPKQDSSYVPPHDELPAHLEVQLSRRTGRATWVAIQAPEGLSASELQRLPWASILAVADAADRGLRDDATAAQDQHVSDVLSAHATKSRLPSRPEIVKRPGMKGHPDEHYRAVAERYKELRSGTGVRNPTQRIADEWHFSRNTVAGWIRGARDRGYLPPARPGRAG